jgi:hypothetical protein
VTDLDFQYASLPKETIRFLEEVMPAATTADGDDPHHVNENGSGSGMSGRTYDCES